MAQLIAGNWKMNGLTHQARVLTDEIAQGASDITADLLICPPFTQIATLATLLKSTKIAVGAQDCHARLEGAHTGDISAAMLADIGATSVILGHSERRADHHETNDQVREKLQTAIKIGLQPIVCVGETSEQRDCGEAESVVRAQLAGSLTDDFTGVIAYEPIWAIGTGRVPSEQDVTAMHAAIRAALVARYGEGGQKLRILYGGSVKPSNAQTLLSLPNVGGALIGGASLNATDFLDIARKARGSAPGPR